MHLLEKIFSVKNENIYKVLTILGIRIKFVTAKNVFRQFVLHFFSLCVKIIKEKSERRNTYDQN